MPHVKHIHNKVRVALECRVWVHEIRRQRKRHRDTKRQREGERESEVEKPWKNDEATHEPRTSATIYLLAHSDCVARMWTRVGWHARTPNNHRQHVHSQFDPTRIGIVVYLPVNSFTDANFWYSSSAVKPFAWNEPWIMHNDDDSNRPHRLEAARHTITITTFIRTLAESNESSNIIANHTATEHRHNALISMDSRYRYTAAAIPSIVKW